MQSWQRAGIVGSLVLNSIFGTPVDAQTSFPFPPPPLPIDPPTQTEPKVDKDGDPIEPHDWEKLLIDIQGEQFRIPTHVSFQANRDCQKVITEGGDRSSIRICEAVGIGSTPEEQQEKFTKSADEMVAAINRSMIDSGIPLRLELASMRVSSGAGCPIEQKMCFIVADLSAQGYMGLVSNIPDYRIPQAFADAPFQNAIHIDPAGLPTLHGCDPTIPVHPFIQSICAGEVVVGNFVVSHEFGHFLGLLHTFLDSCTVDADGIPDTPRELGPTYYWGCQNNQTSTVVDSCHQPFETDPEADGVRNMEGYHFELQPDGTWSADGKVFTRQQGILMLTNLIRVFPILANDARITGISGFSYFYDPNNEETTLVFDVKSGERYTIAAFLNTFGPNYYDERIPAVGENEPTDFGHRDTYTITVPFPTFRNDFTFSQLNPVGVVQPNYAIKHTSGEPISGQNYTETVTNGTPPIPLTDEGGTPPPSPLCEAVPYSEHTALPFIIK